MWWGRSSPGVGDDAKSILVDYAEDCRESGRDYGDRCDAGADFETVRLSLDGDMLTAELELSEPPDLSSGISWTLQFFVELENSVICGLSNKLEGGPVAQVLTAYAIDPASRDLLEPTRYAGELNDTTAVFKINATGQSPRRRVPRPGVGSARFSVRPGPARLRRRFLGHGLASSWSRPR